MLLSGEYPWASGVSRNRRRSMPGWWGRQPKGSTAPEIVTARYANGLQDRLKIEGRPYGVPDLAERREPID
jgi:hypothetical protein